MSVSNTTVKQVYSGNGSNKDFAIPFAFISGELTDIDVYTIDTAGVKILKTITTDYTLTPAGDNPTTVEFVSAPDANTKVLVIRTLEYKQVVDYINSGRLSLETLETSLDKLTLMVQQLFDLIGAAPRINILDEGVVTPDIPKFEASKVLGTNAAADEWEWVDITALQGATGPTGATGPRGPQGNNILSGTALPDASVGSEGDLYLRTSTGVLYGPKLATATPWSTSLDLTGPTGPTGPAHTITTFGDRSGPKIIDPAVGITSVANDFDPQVDEQIIFLKGLNAGENQVTVDPQIEDGQVLGQKLTLYSVSATDYLRFEHGRGLRINGPWIGDEAGKTLTLVWDGVDWSESARWGG